MDERILKEIQLSRQLAREIQWVIDSGRAEILEKNIFCALFLHSLELDVNYSLIHAPDFQANRGLKEIILGRDQRFLTGLMTGSGAGQRV